MKQKAHACEWIYGYTCKQNITQYGYISYTHVCVSLSHEVSLCHPYATSASSERVTIAHAQGFFFSLVKNSYSLSGAVPLLRGPLSSRFFFCVKIQIILHLKTHLHQCLCISLSWVSLSALFITPFKWWSVLWKYFWVIVTKIRINEIINVQSWKKFEKKCIFSPTPKLETNTHTNLHIAHLIPCFCEKRARTAWKSMHTYLYTFIYSNAGHNK